MKKIGILFLFILAISCKKEPKLNFVVVSGKIDNYTQGELSLNNYDYSVQEVLDVQKDGAFKDTLFIDNGVYTLNFGSNKAQIYMEGENELVINFDSNNFSNSIKFSGEGHETSVYMFKKGQKLAELFPDEIQIYALDEKAFKAKLKEIENILLGILNETKEVSNSFKSLEERNITYASLRKIQMYKMNHSFITKDFSFEPSQGFFKELESLKVDSEEDFEFSSDYRSLVDMHYRKKSFEIENLDPANTDQSFFNAVGKIESEVIKNGLLYEYVKTKLEFSTEKELLYNSFMKISTNQFNNDKITEKFNEYKKIAKGQPSPDFKNYENLNGGKSSLSDFKGKIILINVWSSSMAPSIAEIQALNEVKKKYAIEIVNISVDIDYYRENWKQTIKTNNMVGVHLLADNNWSSDFIKNYKIKIVPRYILLDKNGVIINSDCHKPTDAKFDVLMNSLNS